MARCQRDSSVMQSPERVGATLPLGERQLGGDAGRLTQLAAVTEQKAVAERATSVRRDLAAVVLRGTRKTTEASDVLEGIG